MAWTPSPNPGGRNRELVATALGEWFMAQHIGGLQAVQLVPIGPDRVDWEAVAIGESGPRCQGIILIPSVTEERAASTGPDNFGGKLAHYETELELHYLSGNPDNWQAAVFDFWRIVDALKDCLRGAGRDIARPDVILQVGEYPREQSISDQIEDPISADGGIYITGTLSFIVSQYMQQQPA
jgi:hypothetical protein